jgi:hypothetical protein
MKKLVRNLLNVNLVIDILDFSSHKWRRGSLGKLGERHSPTAHIAGEGCWCQEGIKKPLDFGQALCWAMLQTEMSMNRDRIEGN